MTKKRTTKAALWGWQYGTGILLAGIVACTETGGPLETVEQEIPHSEPRKIAAVAAPEEELTDISFDHAAISNAVGGKRWKPAACHNEKMYLLSSENDTVWRISQGDEAWDGGTDFCRSFITVSGGYLIRRAAS